MSCVNDLDKYCDLKTEFIVECLKQCGFSFDDLNDIQAAKSRPAQKKEIQTKQILHITTKDESEIAAQKGFYTAPSLEKDGFIHCTLAHQIPAVANYNFKGQ